jgi:hypothetical protein
MSWGEKGSPCIIGLAIDNEWEVKDITEQKSAKQQKGVTLIRNEATNVFSNHMVRNRGYYKLQQPHG